MKRLSLFKKPQTTLKLREKPESTIMSGKAVLLFLLSLQPLILVPKIQHYHMIVSRRITTL